MKLRAAAAAAAACCAVAAVACASWALLDDDDGAERRARRLARAEAALHGRAERVGDALLPFGGAAGAVDDAEAAAAGNDDGDDGDDADSEGDERFERLGAWIVERGRPVAGARVRIVSPRRVPPGCDGDDVDDPERCAADYNRALLDRCNLPRTLARAASDERGWVAFDADAVGAAAEATRDDEDSEDDAAIVEVERGELVSWSVVRFTSHDISIELDPAVRPRFRIISDHYGATDTVDMRGARAALIFETGHCVPLELAPDDDHGDERADRGALWRTTRKVPPAEAYVVVDAPGAHVLTELWLTESEEQQLYLAPVIDDDEDGDDDDDDGDDGDRGDEGCAECADMEDDEPADEASCVDVVDGAGQPLAGAGVLRWVEEGVGLLNRTDGEGRVCDDVFRGAVVTVSAPRDAGGDCAGTVNVVVPEAGGVVRAVLPFAGVARVEWRGKVLSPDGRPVNGALVQLSDAADADTDTDTDGDGDGANGNGCTVHIDDVGTSTGADGRFRFPPLPRAARARVVVKHRWFAPSAQVIELAAPPAEIVLEWPARWSGRVVGAERCHVRLFTATAPSEEERATDDVVGDARCQDDGAFRFDNVPAERPLQAWLYVDGRLEIHGIAAFAAGEERQADVRVRGAAGGGGDGGDGDGDAVLHHD